MRAFGADLSAALEGRQPAARREPSVLRMLKRASKLRLNAGIMVLLLLIVAAVCIMIGLSMHG